MERVRDFLELDTPPPEEPGPARLDQETVDRAANVLGAEGNLRRAMREAQYPHASTDPDQQRQIQREIAEETVQQVNLEDSLANLRLIRALMVAAQTGGEKAYQLWQWIAGALSGVYDNAVYPDVTSWGPQAMLSQRGLKGLYSDYRDTFSFVESFSADTPRSRREICEQRQKTDQERIAIELSWADSGAPANHKDPYYRRVTRRAAILEAMETAFDHEPDPRRE